MPNVSVIVPNYNHEQYLQQRIESIVNQTYQDFELILLDDFSTDNSRDILNLYRNHPKVSKIVFNEKNSGSPFKQWNKGIELAQGKYIWIAESDDWAEPNFLEVVVDGFTRYKDVGLIYTLSRYMLERKEAWNIVADDSEMYYKGIDFVKNKLLYCNSIYNVSMVVFEKMLYSRIDNSLYDTMRLCGDWFFYVQLCEYTNVLQIKSLLNNYRMHDTNTSSKAEREGLSFLEGLQILNYITRKQCILAHSYSFQWGRMWVKYKRKFNFSKQTNNRIKKMTLCHNKLILFYYSIVEIFYFLKNK